MNPAQIKAEVDNLALAEKLTLVEEIWDSIAEGNNEIPLREWQRKELDRRYEAYQKGNVKLYSWQEVHERLRNK